MDREGGHVLGHVLPRRPVAAGGGLDEAAVLVRERHGQAVDLQLALEVGAHHGRVDPGDPVDPRLQLVEIEGVVQAHHGNPVGHRGEEHRRGGAHPLRR